ncbi:hypothetical protein TGPRC2_292245 [Toxoplasma gondii TgCatPRC2]|uniref:Uncharacterized protein n=2 Tax=Toxoplasma gondii TaxID=5811 RepID=A0A151HK90_TOXGO|nr:hypothetical protein TGARI_292245 [Toxoplasma gondii ARI]KYK69793.1 hypothetical protein TGPRC2_292245 [Toxoplasma gondii TgCatPRC2]
MSPLPPSSSAFFLSSKAFLSSVIPLGLSLLPSLRLSASSLGRPPPRLSFRSFSSSSTSPSSSSSSSSPASAPSPHSSSSSSRSSASPGGRHRLVLPPDLPKGMKGSHGFLDGNSALAAAVEAALDKPSRTKRVAGKEISGKDYSRLMVPKQRKKKTKHTGGQNVTY